MNIRTTNSGIYKLEINSSIRHRWHSSSISSFKSFHVAIIESEQSVVGIYVGIGVFLVVVVVAAVMTTGVIYCCRNNSTQPGQNRTTTLNTRQHG
ncbi:hypothetical protein QQF64_019475 [Cirrhinus molitorella]|uniref:Uncharacterized protein n=1 Tax=Cirrhinus molitorella TaxID=172907 RepID=A0ABR3LIY7_9TELE